MPDVGTRLGAGHELSAMSRSKPAVQAFTLDFPQVDRALANHPGETIYQTARRGGVRIIGACGGRGTCGTCRVKVSSGEIDASAGKARLGRRGGWLRACQVTPLSDCIIEIGERSLASVVRAEFDAADAKEILPLDPAVVSEDVSVPEATLLDNVSDLDRVTRAVPAVLEIDIEAARQLPARLRDGQWSLRVHRRGGELIGFSHSRNQRTFGLAVDLGTTNVAGFLVDLVGGSRVATLGIENPQVAWGADVISRMNHAMQGPTAAAELQKAAVTAVDALAHDL